MARRLILHVDILEILTLAWDHPLVTGGLALMLTPPMFPVLVFFSPLLICTALCAVALVSVGHQIDTTMEREPGGGWNARVVDGDRLPARFANARSTRNRVPEVVEESWLDWAGSGWNNSGNTLTEDIKEEALKFDFRANDGGRNFTEEGLKVDFRANDGGRKFTEEEILDRQIEAFRDYERSFSSKRDRERAAGAGIQEAPTNSGALPGVTPSPKEMVPFPTQGNDKKPVSATQIPPDFLYNLRTGGTGTAAVKCRDGASLKAFPTGGAHIATAPASVARKEATAAPELVPFGSFHMSGIADAVDRALDGQRDSQQQQRSMFEKGASATAAAETQVSPVAALTHLSNVKEKHLSNVEEKIVSPESPIERNHSLEGEFMGFTTTVSGGGTSPSRLISQISLTTSSGVLPAKKPSEQTLRARSYNASTRVDNAVLYNASSESSNSRATLEHNGSGGPRSKHSSNRDRRMPTSSRRHSVRETSLKHPFQLDIRNSDDWTEKKYPHSDR